MGEIPLKTNLYLLIEFVEMKTFMTVLLLGAVVTLIGCAEPVEDPMPAQEDPVEVEEDIEIEQEGDIDLEEDDMELDIEEGL